jgi:hypothetical protein
MQDCSETQGQILPVCSTFCGLVTNYIIYISYNYSIIYINLLYITIVYQFVVNIAVRLYGLA